MADNLHRGSTLDGFFEEEGVLAELQAKAIREVIASRLAEVMRERKLSKNRLAIMLHTGRTQVGRLLDLDDGDVTIEILQRAAALVGCRVELQLVRDAAASKNAGEQNGDI
jgi:predicted transcriptional regulator